jgi:DmsE family decaheme c-type cytochrome
MFIVIVIVIVASTSCVFAQSSTGANNDTNEIINNIEATLMPGTYSGRGADTCLKCHGDDGEHRIYDIFKTKHAREGDQRTPFAGLQCEACHGPGVGGPEAHETIVMRGGHTGTIRGNATRPPILSFGPQANTPVKQQNKMCTNCHQSLNHISLAGSAHKASDVGCASCHTVHAEHDPVLATRTQAQVCYGCHLRERADFAKPSAHPVHAGQITCSDCHNTHGSTTRYRLVKPTVNQTCYTCHAEKRGPLLWEHAPVSDACGLCHEPHGSIHPGMLSKRAPLLCQQCHAQNGHPSALLSGFGLADGTRPSAMVLGRSCLNCHVQIHGSNHPSGAKLMR